MRDCLQNISARLRGRRAFTMLEMIIVTAILMLCIFGAVKATLNLISTSDRLESEGNNCVAVFNSARAQAIAESAWFRVTFFTDQKDGTRWWIDKIAPNTSATTLIAEANIADDVTSAMVRPIHKIDPTLMIEGIRVNNGNSNTTYTMTNGNAVVVRFKPNSSADEAEVTFAKRGSDNAPEGTARAVVSVTMSTGKAGMEIWK